MTVETDEVACSEFIIDAMISGPHDPYTPAPSNAIYCALLMKYAVVEKKKRITFGFRSRTGTLKSA